MNALFVVIFVLIGSAYSRSIPQPSAPSNPQFDLDVTSLDQNSVPLVRKARQFGYFNNYDYNPYNDTPNNYDNNPFNDSPHRRLYNNFDFNPYNDSPNNYDANPFNDSGFFGKK